MRDSSLQRTHFHCSRVQWWRALHHSSRRLALGMVILGLCAAARPWKPISWSSWRIVIVLTLLLKVVWNSVVNVAAILWSCVAYYFAAEPLLLLDCFHLTIKALTVDQSRQTYLLERLHPMTAPRWLSSLSISVRAILLPMFVYGDCMTVCSILYICQQLVWLKWLNPLIWRSVHISSVKCVGIKTLEWKKVSNQINTGLWKQIHICRTEKNMTQLCIEYISQNTVPIKSWHTYLFLLFSTL
jgi:hypothetical protein